MEKNRKCVMVMDASLAPGIAANTAALLGMTLGSKVKEYEDVIIVDFSDAAQTCNVYEDWIVKAKNLPENQFHYLGIGLYGDKKKINRLCGSLPLYR